MAEAQLQLNLSFVPIEDRLLLRIASGKPGAMEEYRLWLTRRFVNLLWNVLDQMLEIHTALDPRIPPEGRKAVLQFQQSAALFQTDFKTPYNAENVTAPLGPTPLLIYKLQSRETADENQMLSMEATTGQIINITLNLQLIHSLRKLIADTIKEAGWNLFNVRSIAPEEAVFVAEAPRTIN